MSAAHVEPREYLMMIRDEIKHEDSLINFRLSWLLATQAFLFTAYAVAQDNNNHLFIQDGRYLIQIIGLVTTAAIFLGLLAAINSFNHWQMKLHQFYRDPANLHFPKRKRPRFTIGFGFIAPTVLPIFLSCVWIFLLKGHRCWIWLALGISIPLASFFILEPLSKTRKALSGSEF
jgi:hypothetical protein